MLFIITNSDGDTDVRAVSEDEFLRELNSGAYGSAPKFIDQITNTDTNYWPEGSVLVIRGEIVVPQPKRVVQEYGL